jgi:hypothetical protein
MAAHDDTGHESVETLLELQRQWHTALASRLEEYVNAVPPERAQEAVRSAFSETVGEHLAVRLVLDEFADHPALALPRRWEHTMIADAAGLSSDSHRNRDTASAGAMLVADLHPDPVLHQRGGRQRHSRQPPTPS